MAHKDSPDRASFDETHWSASDEDRMPVEVMFEDPSPYRRKSSLVASDSIPPHLRREPPAHNNKTECLVHQFLANQRKPEHRLPTRHHQQHQPREQDEHHEHHRHRLHDITRAHHKQTVTASPEAADLSSPEAKLDRSQAPDLDKDKHNEAAKKEGKEQQPATQPCATVLPDDSCTTTTSSEEAASSSNPPSFRPRRHHGQSDEKQWRREMIGPTPTTPAPESGPEPASTTTAAAAAASRLLTKKQLSEMAWGVRELSRRLGSMRLKFRVKTVFVLTKIHDAELIAKTRALCAWLLDRERDVRYTVYVDRELRDSRRFDVAGLLEGIRKEYVDSGEVSEEASWDVGKRLRYWDEEICRTRPHTFDFVITLGGDGTVLYASWLFQRIVPPVLSFALGSLGFLTKFDFEDHAKTLTSAFSEGVTVSLRLRFEATVMRSQKRERVKEDGVNGVDEAPMRDLVEELIGEEKDDEHTHHPDGTYEVLNEVVVDRGPNPTMSNIEIFGDDEHFTSVSADGICVSTPTGSTAYNLAAGGSLCHPENPVMLVTAICAHTLSFRPVILPDTIVLRIGVPYDARASSWASFDGRERVELRPGDYVTVSASRYPFACVQPHGRRSEDWINSISAKLGWNTRQRQKGYKEWEK